MFVVWVRGIYIISITKGAGRRSTRRHPEISKNMPAVEGEQKVSKKSSTSQSVFAGADRATLFLRLLILRPDMVDDGHANVSLDGDFLGWLKKNKLHSYHLALEEEG